MKNIVKMIHNPEALYTQITVNGKPFDTSKIDGRRLDDWITPFITVKCKWYGIFEELAMAVGSKYFEIEFAGSVADMCALDEKCPGTVEIVADNSGIARKFLGENICTDYERYVLKYRSATTDNSPIAQFNLGKAFLYGDELPQDYERSFNFIRKAAKNGHAEAMEYMAFFYYNGIIVEKNHNAAYDWIKKAVEKGFEEAKTFKSMLDMSRDNNIVMPPNAPKVIISDENRNKRYIKNYDNIDDFMINVYLDFYTKPRPSRESLISHLEYVRRCADEGMPFAKFVLSEQLLKGEYVKKNVEEAIVLLIESAEEGCEDSEYKLGTLLCEGEYIEKDTLLGYSLIRRAADKNIVGAQIDYADECLRQKDYETMAYYLEKAALSDSNEALYRLGMMYFSGFYYEEDQAKAMEYFARASESGEWI